jgi:hypothetical protein
MKSVVAGITLSLMLLAAPAFAQESETGDDSGGLDMALTVRTGFTGNVAVADPTFYGIGGVAEPMIGLNQFGAGLRVDGMALFGVDLGEDVQAGVRILAGVLPKVEYRIGKAAVQPVIGLAGGLYAIGIVGASVANDQEDVGALAGGGQVGGIAPQLGINFGGFRIAALSHLVFGAQVEPVFALELSWNTWEFGL